jgi:hypothetical protein
MFCPAPNVDGTEKAEIRRSVPILIKREYVLFVSEVSITTSSPSALAIRYQLPELVPNGMVTEVDPELLAPAARAGTLRLPSRMSDSPMLVLVDR